MREDTQTKQQYDDDEAICSMTEINELKQGFDDAQKGVVELQRSIDRLLIQIDMGKEMMDSSPLALLPAAAKVIDSTRLPIVDSTPPLTLLPAAAEVIDSTRPRIVESTPPPLTLLPAADAPQSPLKTAAGDRNNHMKEKKKKRVNKSRLHGVKYHSIIMANTPPLRDRPAVVICIGEKHGKQKCGDNDYVSAYKGMLLTNEDSESNVELDIFLETANDIKEDKRAIPEALKAELMRDWRERDDEYWIDMLREEFRECYTYYLRHACRYKKARFHWSDPLNHEGDKAKWLDVVGDIPSILPDGPDGREEFPDVSKKIKSKKDLLKIIFEDPNILKEGTRCSIHNWKQFVQEQHENMLEITAKKYPELYPKHWWALSIFETARFKMDVFALLRMCRINDARFNNVIYHAGAWHTENMTRMLTALKTEGGDAMYKLSEERRVKDNEDLCMNIDMNHVLKILHVADEYKETLR